MSKTVEEINRRIEDGSVRVVTAERMPEIVSELGPEGAAAEVDVVTTGTFGAMCSSGVFLNFGHSDPPIKMTRVWLNDVEAYAGLAAVDAYLGATQESAPGSGYGGAHVVEDLLLGRRVVLRAVSWGTDCYPRKEILGEVSLAGLNQAILCNPRNAYQRYNAAANSGKRTLHTYMGKLLPGCANVTFSGAGELSPLMNDPGLEAIGVGTRIFLGGGTGFIGGPGTQSDPQGGFATLMVQGDLKGMTAEFLQAAFFPGYGPTLYVGIGVPIPVLDAGIAHAAAVRDRDIETAVVDFGVPRRRRPVLARCDYGQRKSGTVRLGERDVPAAPLSSLHMAGRIARELKERIEGGRFFLSAASAPLPRQGAAGPLSLSPVGGEVRPRRPSGRLHPGERVAWRRELCFSCGQCLGICPAGVFGRDASWRGTAATGLCTGCGLCDRVCPAGAIVAEASRGGDDGR